MLFSENNQEWISIPKWIEFLIRFGAKWPNTYAEQRRIALVSMPCDSAAAGLIALGSLIRDLGSRSANDVDGHYDNLLRYARQYLESCKFCGSDCKPDIKRCGYTDRATGQLRSPLYPRKIFTISEKTDIKNRQLVWNYNFGRGKTGTQCPSPDYATNWHIEDHPQIKLDMTEEQLLSDPYHQLCGDISILPENLSLTWSGLCLAGRIMGENAAREICASICFRNGEDQYRLPELLTVHGWSQHDGPSRMTFFNSRTDHLDRRSSLPALVVTDGVACFLKVLINSEFQRSDIIGVIHRTIERDPLEVIGSRLIGLSQWYAQDSETLEKMLPIPRGISISVLRKRST